MKTATRTFSIGPQALGKVSSPIRWAGSKKKLLPVLSAYWRPTDKKYIEAFSGSARLFFYLQPKVAVLNDTNADLISALSILADSPRKIFRAVSKVPVDAETYYQIRANRPETKFGAAVRFFYLNRNCFNGIYRTNKAGDFNVPFGVKTGALPEEEAWFEASRLLGAARLECRDFEAVVKDHVAAGDFVYLDPPYAVSNRRVFRQYSATEFGISDLERLRAVMTHIDRVGATFVVSYAQSKETKLLEEGWFSYRQRTLRNVAGFSHDRRHATEVIITNHRDRIPR